MTVQDILSVCCDLQGITIGAVPVGSTADAEFYNALNHALRSICNFGEWKWLNTTGSVSTTQDQETVNLPSDFVALTRNRLPFFSAGRGVLNKLDGAYIDACRGSGASSTGLPQGYDLQYSSGSAVWQLRLYPTPDAVYAITVPYRRHVAELSTRTAVPAIPAHLHRTLAIGAAARWEEVREKLPEGSQAGAFRAMLAAEWATDGDPVSDQTVMARRELGAALPRGFVDVTIA